MRIQIEMKEKFRSNTVEARNVSLFLPGCEMAVESLLVFIPDGVVASLSISSNQ